MPKMSKTTYEQFAARVGAVKMPSEVFYDVLHEMIEVFVADNPHQFNATLFVEACEKARAEAGAGAVYSSIVCEEV